MLISSTLKRIIATRFLNSIYSLNSIKCGFSNTRVLLEESGRLSGATHRVNNLEKKFLVWTGKFKTAEEVPTYVAPDVIERARNRMRIRISNVMMLLTVVACIIMAKSGKKMRDEGDSLAKRTMDQHNLLRQEAMKEKEKTSTQ